jgi:hypothetical protein
MLHEAYLSRSLKCFEYFIRSAELAFVYGAALLICGALATAHSHFVVTHLTPAVHHIKPEMPLFCSGIQTFI